jgi:O-antigen/teichoic acid export membrane protein
MSRVSASITNAKFSTLLFIITAFLGFFSRDFFLQHLGPEFMGIVAILFNIIGVIGVVELGIGTSISYRLYKPILNIEENKDEINQVMGLFGFLYSRIALIILLTGLIISFFLNQIISNETFSLILIYYLFFLFLLNSILVFLFNFQQIIFIVDQNYYKIGVYSHLFNILKILTQIIVLYYTKNLFIWGFIEFIFPVLYSIVLNRKIKKHYPWLKKNRTIDKSSIKDYNEIIKKTKQVFVQKLGVIMLTNTDNLFINWYAGLKMVTYYTNYLIILHTIRILLTNIFTNLLPSIANLIAEGNQENTIKVFYETFVFKFFIATILVITVYFTIESFMILWLKNYDYILPKSTLYIILLLFLITEIKETVDFFLIGFGMFHDVWAIILEFSLNFVFSIILGYYFGLNGVLGGTLISSFFVLIWKPYFLFKHGFKISVKNFVLKYLKLVFSFIIILTIILFLNNFLQISSSKSYFNWFIYASIIFILTFLSTFILFFILNKEFKFTIKRLKGILLRIK